MKRSKSVDDYIRESAFWQAELKRLREILKKTELTEEIKWGGPCYTYDGKNVVGLGAFKSYVGLWFHQGALLKDDKKRLINAQEGKTRALRQWRMTSASDIKPAIIKAYVNEAIQLVKSGKGIGPAKKKPVVVPPELENVLRKDQTSGKKFHGLTPGRQREYAEYIAEATRAETKQTRLAKILPMVKAGIGLNDKYRKG
jgi:uncharacterized protein YdeI (YjbR/CyaY-like superfamily)